MGKPRKYTDNQFIEAVRTSDNLRQVLKKLNIKEAGGNYKTTKQRIKALNLDISKWGSGKDRQAWCKGKQRPNRYYTPLSEILVENSYYKSHSLRIRLINEKIFEKKCHKCNLTEWLGMPIALELEHINGKNTDNRIENLTLLCPNCHAQTKTYRGRNKQTPRNSVNNK